MQLNTFARKHHIGCLPVAQQFQKSFVIQLNARFVVLTEPVDEILKLYFVRLMVVAGPASDRIFVFHRLWS